MAFILECAQMSCAVKAQLISTFATYEPCSEKTGHLDFRPGPKQTGKCNDRRWLEAENLGFRK